MRLSRSPSIFALGLVLVACGEKTPADASATATDPGTGAGESTAQSGSSGPASATDDATGNGTTAGGSNSATEGGSTSGPTATSEPVGSSTAADDTVNFIVEPDGGVAGQCDPTVQDCPRGEKCTAVSDMRGEPWGVYVCVQLQGDSQVGDPCDIENGKYTGIDNCDVGLICLLTDDEGKGGACVEFCDVESKCPETGAKCVVYNDGSLPICLVDCDPLIQDCPEGQACYNSAGDNFVCFKESAMPGEGGPGSECTYINQCQKGSFCANPALVEGCSAESGCCTPYCSVMEGDAPCQPMEDCEPFFVPGMAPPGYEDVGVCAIPE